jgi:soluble lytic murein transglycosylase
MKRLLCFILFVSFCIPAYAAEPDGKAYLQKGKHELGKRQFENAIVSLTEAEKALPLLGDYALLWISDAYHETGNHREALKTVRTLLKKYPLSPLAKKSRAREIEEAREVSEENIQQLYEAYIKDYPDSEMKYLFAQWLKQNGQEEKARGLFKDIYIDAGLYSSMAYGEIGPSGISIEETVKRASNLIRCMEYEAAESALRIVREKDDGRFRTEILKNLGLALFKQKRYREAAEVYRSAGERFWEVRSLYRAGEKGAVDASLEELLSGGEQRFGAILLAVAADKRKDGNIEEALRIYRVVMDRFPSEAEEALWGAGWTHFLSGEYRQASDIFSRLYGTYDDPKYLYWKNRSLEAAGEVVLANDRVTSEKGPDYYRIMLQLRRIQATPLRSGGSDTKELIKPLIPAKGTSTVYRKIERIETLLDIGLPKEAVSELIYLSKKTGSPDDIYSICSKLQELGEYTQSVRSALKVPYAEEFHQFLYPFAYRNIVEELSMKFTIDPLLVLSIMREESRFDAGAKSPAGAMGLMQLMPGTASLIDRKLNLGIKGSHDLLDMKTNLHIGTCYLSRLVREFGSYTYAVAAYNAGEDTVRKWLQKRTYTSADEFIEDIPYSETRNYVKKVITSFFEYKRAYAQGTNPAGIDPEKL